ncbi:tail fiber assembly protein [Pseudomonas petrae]|nr:tail fiber assembly protein [Pseudomonas petrae]
MMKVYARVLDGEVWEIIPPFAADDGSEVPIEDRFPAEFVAELVEITGLDPQPDQRWTYKGKKFAAPVPYQATPDEIRAANTAERDRLLSIATLAIAPLQDAADLEEATASETAMLKKWKQYRVAVNRVDLVAEGPDWPGPPA